MHLGLQRVESARVLPRFAFAEVTERIEEELISMVSSTTATYTLHDCYVLFVTDHYADVDRNRPSLA